MKGQIRNFFPGGNTPRGFHSYYNYILPQRKAKKIFCLKGGPGVGKSTLMKKIAEHYLDKGEAVEFLWCSSDPMSLDGIVLRNIGVAMIDGTAPHVVDPITPGAVDEIINLGSCWDEKGIVSHKDSIMECSSRISHKFSLAYVYLRCAGEQYEALSEILDNTMESEQIIKPIKRLRSLTDLFMQSAGKGTSRDFAKIGAEKKAFAGAITPMGLKNHTESLHNDIGKVIFLEVPIGFRSERFLEPVSDMLLENGFDVEKYYCPMDPENKLEHIVSHDANMAVITCNKYHGRDSKIRDNIDVETITIDFPDMEDNLRRIYDSLLTDSERNIYKAVEYLEMAKSLHDELEGYYIPNMDFKKISMIGDSVIGKINEYVLY